MVDNRWITSIQHAQKRGFALKRITLQCIRNGDVDGMRALFAPQENLSTISGALSDDLDHAVIACLFTWAQAAFAAETGDPLDYAKAKLVKKNADLVVANDVSSAALGMGTVDNHVWFVERDGVVELPTCSKRAIARELLSRVAKEL